MDLEENTETEEQKADSPEESSGPSGPIVESMRILEALLFASDELLTTERLKSIVPGQPDARKIRQMVDKINVQFQKERHPFEIVEIGGGYQFRTVSYYYQWVQQLFKEKSAKKLSIQSLECLAIISYKQPITKAEIEAIRGVLSDGAMKTLLEKRLVTVSGRSEKAGDLQDGQQRRQAFGRGRSAAQRHGEGVRRHRIRHEPRQHRHRHLRRAGQSLRLSHHQAPQVGRGSLTT